MACYGYLGMHELYYGGIGICILFRLIRYTLLFALLTPETRQINKLLALSINTLKSYNREVCLIRNLT